jgi:hypothetical protein
MPKTRPTFPPDRVPSTRSIDDPVLVPGVRIRRVSGGSIG